MCVMMKSSNCYAVSKVFGLWLIFDHLTLDFVPVLFAEGGVRAGNDCRQRTASVYAFLSSFSMDPLHSSINTSTSISLKTTHNSCRKAILLRVQFGVSP
jgi:hypothetical protein